MSDELIPRKRKARSAPQPLESMRAGGQGSVTPPHGDKLGQAPTQVEAVPVDPEPVRSERRDEHIARRAYELYEARGSADGDPMQDWLEAERQVDAEIDAQSSRR